MFMFRKFKIPALSKFDFSPIPFKDLKELMSTKKEPSKLLFVAEFLYWKAKLARGSTL